MTPETLGNAGAAGLVVVVVLGAFQLIKFIIARQGSSKKTSVPPSKDCAPCNEAVEKLTTTMDENVKEQRAFRELFVKWMAREEGYRAGLRETGEHPLPGGGGQE